MIEMRSEFSTGLEKAAAYGAFWRIVEMLGEAPNNELNYQPKLIAESLNIDVAFAKQLLDVCLSKNLFCLNDASKTFFAPGLKKRIERYKATVEARKIAGSKGGKARVSRVLQAIAKQKPSKAQATPQANASYSISNTSLEVLSTFEDQDLTLNANQPSVRTRKKPQAAKTEYAPGVFLTAAEREGLQPKLEKHLRQVGLPITAGSVDALLECFATKKKSKGYVYKCDRSALDDWGISAYAARLVKERDEKRITPATPSNRPEHRIVRAERKTPLQSQLIALATNKTGSVG